VALDLFFHWRVSSLLIIRIINSFGIWLKGTENWTRNSTHACTYMFVVVCRHGTPLGLPSGDTYYFPLISCLSSAWSRSFRGQINMRVCRCVMNGSVTGVGLPFQRTFIMRPTQGDVFTSVRPSVCPTDGACNWKRSRKILNFVKTFPVMCVLYKRWRYFDAARSTIKVTRGHQSSHELPEQMLVNNRKRVAILPLKSQIVKYQGQ